MWCHICAYIFIFACMHLLEIEVTRIKGSIKHSMKKLATLTLFMLNRKQNKMLIDY